MTIDELRNDHEQAETAVHKLNAEYDDARANLKAEYADRLKDASEKAAQAQKRLNDAEAAEALQDRPDGEAVAKDLGLTL